jgi:hypothetical protein
MVLYVVPYLSMSHKCEILIPLVYGRRRTKVEPEVLLKIIEGFNVQFGGHTPLGMTASPPGITGAGGWSDPDTGEVVKDVCWLVRVYVEPDLLEVFERMAHSIGLTLEQKVMLIDIGPDTGKFLKMIEPEDEPDNREEKSEGGEGKQQKGTG